MKTNHYIVCQVVTYQIEVEALSEEDARDAARGFDFDRWEIVDCSDREAVER